MPDFVKWVQYLSAPTFMCVCVRFYIYICICAHDECIGFCILFDRVAKITSLTTPCCRHRLRHISISPKLIEPTCGLYCNHAEWIFQVIGRECSLNKDSTRKPLVSKTWIKSKTVFPNVSVRAILHGGNSKYDFQAILIDERR